MMMMMMMIIIIQFNSYLFMCRLNSTEAITKSAQVIHIQRKYKKPGNKYNNNNNKISIIPSTQVKVIIRNKK
jgi:hypothetical protein